MPPGNCQTLVRALLPAGVLLACGMWPGTLPGADGGCAQDARCVSLRKFFERHRSPLAPHSERFIAAAEQHSLDWRLLPGIAMAESGGGKFCRHHNVFGWNSGRARFTSIEAGILHVASRLAGAPRYRGKTAREILRAYNPARGRYHLKVVAFMHQISPDPVE